jgi:predicted nucleotidyltransferase
MIHPFIKIKLPELNRIFNQYMVKSAHLFGSACTQAFGENSDIDLLIEMKTEPDPVKKGENLWAMYYDIKKLMQREVDIVTKDSLVNQYFIDELNSTSESIYG